MKMKLLIAAILLLPFTAQASPEQDAKIYRAFFTQKFPSVKPLDEFGNGSYALDQTARANWLEIEEFPPYEAGISKGETLWNTPFKNGKTYASCLGDNPAIAGKYPHWDKAKGQVVTLISAIQECRKANGEEPLPYQKGALADLNAYIAFKSRGQKINVVIPKDAGAQEAYEKGKQFYFARRGQLNLSCAHCHFQYSGSHLRTEVLSPALGHTTHWPVYRSDWGELGTLHRRFAGCNEQVRAKAFAQEGEEYRNLEYFLTHMSNGLALNGPGARK